MRNIRITIAAAAALLAPAIAVGQTDPKAELRRAIDAAIRPLLGDDSGRVAEKLIGVKPDGFISRNFDVAKVKSALFTRLATSDAPDCRTTLTPAGERDTGMCLVEFGNRDVGEAAYRVLAFSKNIGIGEIEFARRDAFTGNLPAPVTLTDATAYDIALSFFKMLGVPPSEIPEVPKGAQLPVRSMVVGSADEKGGNRSSLVTHKVVSIPRAFVVPGGLITDPNSGRTLMHAIAPGSASAAIAADGSVRFAHIEGWSDAQMDVRGKSRSTTALVDEITEDLYGEGARKVGTMSVLIGFRKAYPNPDDPNPPTCPVCGVLRPALKVLVSQVGRDPVQSSERAWIAPGLVREYDLLGGESEFDRTAPR